MKKITLNEARKLFLSSDAKYVSQEQSVIYYHNFSGDLEISTYTSFKCLVVKSGSYWHIHALSKESDIISAMDDVKNSMGQTEKLMVFTWDNIPNELDEYGGSYKFARGYKPYIDDMIRPITMEDCAKIEKCCSPDAEDNQVGQALSSEFLACYKDALKNPCAVTLGIFEGDEMAGFIQAFEQDGLGLSIINLFVNRAYRKKGYAKRLLSAICATSEDLIYCYSCVKTNTASANTAKACGFEFKGAYLFVC